MPRKKAAAKGRFAGISTEGNASDVGKALLNKTGHAKAVREALQKSATRVTIKSRRKMGSRPGGGLYKRIPEQITNEDRRDGAVMRLKGGDTTIGAEFGMSRHMLFGKAYPQKKMKRRVMPPGIKRAKVDGYIVGSTIKETMTDTQKDVRDAVLDEIAKELAKKGVRVYKRGLF